MKIRYMMLFVFLSISMSSHAANWTASLDIKSVRVHPNYVAVYLNNNIIAPDADSQACAGSVIAINRNAPIYKDALSVLIAANIAKQKLKFYVDGCNWGYMHATVVWLNQP